jgi:DNA-binding PucR family transcriptional regulator
MLGFEPDSPVSLVVSSVEDCPEPLECLDAAFASLGIRSGSTSASGRVVSFVQVGARDFDADSVGRAACESLGPRAYTGVGSLALEPAGLRRSLLEADYACRLAMRRGPEQPHHATYAAAGSHLLLLALLDRDVLAVYRRAVLEPLLDHDSQSTASLIETVRTFLASGQQSSVTARQLGIHVNTLKHRLRQVERLTGRDLRSTADITDLYLAIAQE